MHVVIGELCATGVNTFCLGRQSTTVNYFVLELDVFQLIFQIGFFRAFDNLRSGCEGNIECEVIVESLWVENTMVGQDLMV